MRRRHAGALALLGMSLWGGCGPAEIVPATPPGVPFRKAMGEGMDAEGEQKAKNTIRPANVNPGGATPTPAPANQ